MGVQRTWRWWRCWYWHQLPRYPEQWRPHSHSGHRGHGAESGGAGEPAIVIQSNLNLYWCPVFLHCWQRIPCDPCHKNSRCQGGRPAIHPDRGSLHCVGHGRGAGQLSAAGLFTIHSCYFFSILYCMRYFRSTIKRMLLYIICYISDFVNVDLAI